MEQRFKLKNCIGVHVIWNALGHCFWSSTTVPGWQMSPLSPSITSALPIWISWTFWVPHVATEAYPYIKEPNLYRLLSMLASSLLTTYEHVAYVSNSWASIQLPKHRCLVPFQMTYGIWGFRVVLVGITQGDQQPSAVEPKANRFVPEHLKWLLSSAAAEVLIKL